MAKKNNGKKNRGNGGAGESVSRLHPETMKSIWAIASLGVAALLVLAGVEKAGPLGAWIHAMLVALVGWGYFVIPGTLAVVALVLLFSSERKRIIGTTFLGAVVLVLSILGIIHILAPTKGGWFGYVLGSLQIPFGEIAAIVINAFVLAIALLATLNSPIRFNFFKKNDEGEEEEIPLIVKGTREMIDDEEAPAPNGKIAAKGSQSAEKEKNEDVEPEIKEAFGFAMPKGKKTAAQTFANYVAPPLDLLKASSEKPTTGDLRANANIVKRTLESFGIAVEMGEINIGPKVTRYTLKPAEGVKLSRIVALSQDLSLALAAHPIRIEAPIPGKALVGIEVPNKTAALVRLGSLMAYPEFTGSGPLGFVLGRDVTGEPLFANIEKMPHLLIAGSTGSGKSVMIHSLLLSLLYKNSPATLKLILIDPKRVELSMYENLPHLVSSVITESKKSVGVFRWAISEMDRRYELLQSAGSRDIKSYNTNDGKDDPLPYLVIVVDELADLMTSFGREVEGSIVRLAQMARATGIHLVLSTQRPSVEVITGLIKANITSRIALQVASQIDSRTILDTGGAEKLLGGGDLLFMSSDISKPKRIQGCYVTEEEIGSVADFIREHNPLDFGGSATVNFSGPKGEQGMSEKPKDVSSIFDGFANDGDNDDLYDEAVETVKQAQKASASLLQRRLKVGYARAARLLDIMEERGVIGPGEGAKPREVFVEGGGEQISRGDFDVTRQTDA
jgi:S-DNA-T family DNA segregation ATPase FtsK/SpoIIIE